MNDRTVSNRIAIATTLVVLIAGIILIYERNGILAWLGLLLGAGLLFKFWRRPAKSDLVVGLAVATVWSVAWVAIFNYVISTWETGEVVELTVTLPSGDHQVRTWILEEPASLKLYYDAPGEIADALSSGAPIAVVRNGSPLSVGQYSALQESEMTEEQINHTFALMTEKYGERNAAADVFYGFLGRSRDRVGVVIEFPR